MPSTRLSQAIVLLVIGVIVLSLVLSAVVSPVGV